MVDYNSKEFDIRHTYDQKREPEYYEYAQEFEKSVISAVFPNTEVVFTEGLNHEYDAEVQYKAFGGTIAPLKIEVKATSRILRPGNGIFIETREHRIEQGSGGMEYFPSGLESTKSDMYLFVHPENNNLSNVIKVRLVPTAWLKAAHKLAESTDYEFIQYSYGSKTTYGFDFDIFDTHNHFWVGDFAFSENDVENDECHPAERENAYTWDVSKFSRTNQNPFELPIGVKYLLAKQFTFDRDNNGLIPRTKK